MSESSKMATAGSDRLNFQQGLRTAVAAGLAYWLTESLHMPGGYWAAISAIVVMQSEMGATLTASYDRIAGTAMGAIVGWLITRIQGDSIFLFMVGVLAVMALCSVLHYKNAGRLGGVTVAIIVLAPHAATARYIAIERFLEVSFGIVISLLVVLAWTNLSRLIRGIKT